VFLSFLSNIYISHSSTKMNKLSIRIIITEGKETKFTRRNVDHFVLLHHFLPSSSLSSSNNNRLKLRISSSFPRLNDTVRIRLYTVTIRHRMRYRITEPDITSKCGQFTVPYEPNLALTFFNR
jgi:hypothetical protein